MLAETDADASLRDALARALEANRRLAQVAEELRADNQRLREENAWLRAELAGRDAELEQVKAALAVLQRMVFGRSSEQVPQRGRGRRRGRDGQGGWLTAAAGPAG